MHRSHRNRDPRERRTFPRVPKAVPIRITKLTYPLPRGPGYSGTVKDIGTQGICFRVPVRYTPGTLLSLQVDLKGWRRHRRSVLSILDESRLREPLTVIGEVRWCRILFGGKGWEVGVRFADIHEDDQRALMRYLENCLTR